MTKHKHLYDFCEANRLAARNQGYLENYCNITGELVNYLKSMVQFSKEREKMIKLANILQVPTSNSIGTYL